VLKLIAFTFTLASAGGAHDPTPPTPPTGPTAPKDPEAPSAARKNEKSDKGDKAPAKPAETGKAADGPKDGAKAEAGKGDAHKDDAHKGDAHEAAEKPGSKKGVAKPVRTSAPPPPSLTGSALRQELKQNGGEERGGAPLSERAKLEQMAAEIARAREALKQDTARLESMLRSGGGGDGRMPVGDPMMEPVASPGGAAASKEAMKEQIITVSKAMKGMKPEQAAAIISRLDRVLASEILRRMKPADAGAVMASIKPEVAAELATTIATRKSMVDTDPKGAKK
jgi:hypothetical protein